jgi:hypothetical protein
VDAQFNKALERGDNVAAVRTLVRRQVGSACSCDVCFLSCSLARNEKITLDNYATPFLQAWKFKNGGDRYRVSYWQGLKAPEEWARGGTFGGNKNPASMFAFQVSVT